MSGGASSTTKVVRDLRCICVHARIHVEVLLHPLRDISGKCSYFICQVQAIVLVYRDANQRVCMENWRRRGFYCRILRNACAWRIEGRSRLHWGTCTFIRFAFLYMGFYRRIHCERTTTSLTSFDTPKRLHVCR